MPDADQRSQVARIALVGFFGWGNFGDELFLETHRQFLGDRYELVVANDLTAAPYFSKGIDDVVSKADAVLIGGGDLIDPYLLSGLYWRMEYLQLPTFVFGVGVPNGQKTDPDVMEKLRTFLEHPNCRFIATRDIESRNWLASHFDVDAKLYCFPDPVCAYRFPPSRRNPETKVLGIVMREHRSLVDDMDPVRLLAATAKAQGYEIRHIVLSTLEQRDADERRARSIALHDEEVIVRDSVRELCAEISECTVLASIKFHGVVVATMYGAPAIAMSPTPKNKSFLRAIQRPDLVSDYLDERLPLQIHPEMAGVHSLVRRNLARKARVGYEVLLDHLAEALTAPANRDFRSAVPG